MKKSEIKNFEELELIEPIRRALAEEKYVTPTPIQAQTIPPALDGRDVLGCAQTGTGKTASFALPILNQLGQHNRKAVPHAPFSLILAPTRELAIQIGESFATYGRHLRLRQGLVFGGVKQTGQVKVLKRGAHILVATPGRLLDLMNQGLVKLDQLESFVLDEADRMLDMGFLPDLKRIISKLPKKRQSLFFSATMPPNIVKLSQQLLTRAVNVDVTPKKKSVRKIDQQVYFVERNAKQALLKKILKREDIDRALVFTRTKRGANMLTRRLDQSGVRAAVIHGNKSQNARQRALEAFRSRKVRILVATDVAARGIDIDGISHVVNYDIPVEPESYVHRIGRTGRAGAEGIALSFCGSGEREELQAIERLIGHEVPAAPDQPKRGGARDGHGAAGGNGKPARKSRGRRGPAGKGGGAKGATGGGNRRRRAPRGSTDPAADRDAAGKPKRRRRRRPSGGSAAKKPQRPTGSKPQPAAS